MILRSLGLTALVSLGFGGCAAPQNRAGITSSYPLDRVRAAVACAEAGDARAIDLLIEALNDNDRAVRMYSIIALKRLCGEDYGYRFYASDGERDEAIARWRQARGRGEIILQAPPRTPSAAVSDATPTAEKEGAPSP
jgi:HEAT repeat protein